MDRAIRSLQTIDFMALLTLGPSFPLFNEVLPSVKSKEFNDLVCDEKSDKICYLVNSSKKKVFTLKIISYNISSYVKRLFYLYLCLLCPAQLPPLLWICCPHHGPRVRKEEIQRQQRGLTKTSESVETMTILARGL